MPLIIEYRLSIGYRTAAIASFRHGQTNLMNVGGGGVGVRRVPKWYSIPLTSQKYVIFISHNDGVLRFPPYK